jgi:hypothetical protein
MKEIDQIIREAISDDEDRQWFDELDEQSVHEMVVDSFRGKSRWLVVLVYVMTGVFAGIFLFSAAKFFAADTDRQMMAWAVSAMFCCTTVAMLKIWYWMELQKNAVTREIKRFELQLARLTSRLGEK